jgi:broad specificity phosphatase PhoE
VKRLVVVRHGQTAWSLAGKHTGRTDIPLTLDGEGQARRLATTLADLGLHPRRVLSSPLVRARRTAELAGLGDRLELTDALVEMDYGEYEGMTFAEIRDRRPEWDLFRDGCPGGETVDDVAARAARVIDEVAPEAGDGDVALVAHGHVLRVLAAVYLAEPPAFARALSLATATVSVLGHDHEWRAVELWNDPAR